MPGIQPRTRRRSLPKLNELPWRAIAGYAAVVVILLALLYRQIDFQEVHATARRLNAAVAFGLLVILPLVGFPASVLHVAAGVRFGPHVGLGLVALSILLQLLASYGLVHLFREQFDRRLARLRKRVPKGTHASICVITVLLPGAPFAAINYVLPLIGVPLRTYLLCCLPIHVLRSTVTVTLGGHSHQLTPARLAGLAAYALLILGLSWWTYRRLQSRLEDPPSTADGRKQPA